MAPQRSTWNQSFARKVADTLCYDCWWYVDWREGGFEWDRDCSQAKHFVIVWGSLLDDIDTEASLWSDKSLLF